MAYLTEEQHKKLDQVAILIKNNSANEALQLVDQILLVHPDNVVAILKKSSALISQGKLCDAQNILDAVDWKSCSVSIISELEKLRGCIRSKSWRLLPPELQAIILSMVDTRDILFVSKQWQAVALAPWFVLYKELSSSPYFQTWIDIVNTHNETLWTDWCQKSPPRVDPSKLTISREDIMPKLGDISWRKWLAKIREVRDKGDYFKKLLEEDRFNEDYCTMFADDKTRYGAAYQMYWQLRLKPIPEPNEDAIPLARSKFGGSPDLPESWIPKFTNESGALEIPRLVLQLNIADIPDDYHCKRLLPKKGIFYVLTSPRGAKKMYGNVKLHFYANEISEKFHRLPSTHPFVFKPCRAEFKQILTTGSVLSLKQMSKEERALENISMVWQKKYGRHSLLGLSTRLQLVTIEQSLQKYCDEMYLAKIENSKVLPRKDFHENHVVCSREYPYRCQERLLLEVNSDQDWEFGNEGLMQVIMHQHDLNGGTFDKVEEHFDWW